MLYNITIWERPTTGTYFSKEGHLKSENEVYLKAHCCHRNLDVKVGHSQFQNQIPNLTFPTKSSSQTPEQKNLIV